LARFRKTASPAKQALSVEKSLQRGGHIPSIRTLNNYRERLERVASKLPEYGIRCEIRQLDKHSITQYLTQRSTEVGQKTLDMERQALQSMARHISREIGLKSTLPVIKSIHEQRLTGRAYTAEQVSMVATAQTEKNSISTAIAYAAGLRANELHTLLPINERPADDRPALVTKFEGREGVRYTVVGKGGLVREIILPHDLAEQLETLRLRESLPVTDRGVHYEQHYAIGAGQRWSNSFSRAANRTLEWSAGAHGVRHSYAQERLDELQNAGHSLDLAKETVSQELGHFRPSITDIYLR